MNFLTTSCTGRTLSKVTTRMRILRSLASPFRGRGLSLPMAKAIKARISSQARAVSRCSRIIKRPNRLSLLYKGREMEQKGNRVLILSLGSRFSSR